MTAFGKKERLSQKHLIQDIFRKGKGFSLYPFRAIWLPSDEVEAGRISVLVSVSKHAQRKAVNRNKIKRKMREAYRLNKHLLSDELSSADKGLCLVIIYMSKELSSYSEIEKKIILILERIKGKYEKNPW